MHISVSKQPDHIQFKPTSVHSPSIYINNWIADRLFAKQPASEARTWPRLVHPWIANHTNAILRHPVPTNHSKACWRQQRYPTCWRDRESTGRGHDTLDSIITRKPSWRCQTRAT